MPAAWDDAAEGGNGCVKHREFWIWKEAHVREHDASDRQMVRTAESLAERLEGMNEVREQLREQTGHFINREVAEIKHDAICGEIAVLRAALAESKAWQRGIEGRTIGASAAVGIAVIVITILLKLI